MRYSDGGTAKYRMYKINHKLAMMSGNFCCLRGLSLIYWEAAVVFMLLVLRSEMMMMYRVAEILRILRVRDPGCAVIQHQC